MIKKILYAITLLLIIEFLYFDVEGLGWHTERRLKEASSYSIGFPFRSIAYTTVSVTGQIHSWENYPEREKWRPGLQVRPIFLVLDIICIFFLFYLLLSLVPNHALSLTLGGSCLGILIAGSVFVIEEVLGGGTSESWIYDCIGIFLFFIILPTAICYISSNTTRPKTSSFILTFTVVLFMLLARHRLDDIFISSETTLEMLDLKIGIFFLTVVSIECILILFSRRRVSEIFKSARRGATNPNIIQTVDDRNMNGTSAQ